MNLETKKLDNFHVLIFKNIFGFVFMSIRERSIMAITVILFYCSGGRVVNHKKLMYIMYGIYIIKCMGSGGNILY